MIMLLMQRIMARYAACFEICHFALILVISGKLAIFINPWLGCLETLTARSFFDSIQLSIRLVFALKMNDCIS